MIQYNISFKMHSLKCKYKQNNLLYMALISITAVKRKTSIHSPWVKETRTFSELTHALAFDCDVSFDIHFH